MLVARKSDLIRTNISIEKIIELHNSGLYDREIADIIGCSRHNITQRLNAVGITNRKSKLNNTSLRNRISKSLIGRYIGENNPNYKGNSSLKTLARGLFKTISKRLLRDSNYTCSICNKRGGDIETHHIKPFIVIFNNFLNTHYSGNIDTFYEELLNYDEFVDETNLVVVCHNCHCDIHYTDNPELSPYRWESATTIETSSKDEME